MNCLPRQALVRCVAARRLRIMFSRSSSSSSGSNGDGTRRVPPSTVSTTDHVEQEANDVTEWVPPDRPLAGDLGKTFLYEKIRAADAAPPTVIETSATVTAPKSTTEATAPIDWLSTRRQALSLQVPEKNRRFVGAELEIKVGHLLSDLEITTCLTSMGALHVKTFPDPQGRLCGADGLLICTATSVPHLRLLSDTLVRQLKVRQLAARGVGGAKLGAEGSSTGSDWNVIDCHNYVVHIMLEETRQHLNLEALWSGDDELLRLRLNDEDTVDDYVARNPVPDSFGAMVEVEDIGKHVSQLQKWNMEHKAVVKKPMRKAGSKFRRSPRLL